MNELRLEGYEHSHEFFELMKEAVELDLARTWIRSMEFAAENASMVMLNESVYFSEGIGKRIDSNGTPAESKDNSKVKEKVQLKETGFFTKVGRMIMSLFRMIFRTIGRLLTGIDKKVDVTLFHHLDIRAKRSLMMALVISNKDGGKSMNQEFLKFLKKPGNEFRHTMGMPSDMKLSYKQLPEEKKAIYLSIIKGHFDFVVANSFYVRAVYALDLYNILNKFSEKKDVTPSDIIATMDDIIARADRNMKSPLRIYLTDLGEFIEKDLPKLKDLEANLTNKLKISIDKFEDQGQYDAYVKKQKDISNIIIGSMKFFKDFVEFITILHGYFDKAITDDRYGGEFAVGRTADGGAVLKKPDMPKQRKVANVEGESEDSEEV